MVPINVSTYNGLDTRVGKVDSSGTMTYKRDGVGVTSPLLSDGAANYTPGVSERRSGVSKFTHADCMGTTQALTNGSQSVTDTRGYDAFGMLLSSTGSTPTPFGYAGGYGYQEDGDSGLKLLGHRYYDASTGRFLTRDPAKDGRNWYTYCENNPVRYVDPDGNELLAAICVIGAIAIAIATYIRAASEADTFYGDCRDQKEDAYTPDENGNLDDTVTNYHHGNRLNNVNQTWEIAVDQYCNFYGSGLIGEVGGPPAQIGVAAYEEAKRAAQRGK